MRRHGCSRHIKSQTFWALYGTPKIYCPIHLYACQAAYAGEGVSIGLSPPYSDCSLHNSEFNVLIFSTTAKITAQHPHSWGQAGSPGKNGTGRQRQRFSRNGMIINKKYCYSRRCRLAPRSGVSPSGRISNSVGQN